ncbi:MAG: response regulator [Thermoguttaceae bacterium]|jgi:CheY-like chemotaxis protein
MSRGTVGRPMEILMVEDDLEDAGLTIEALHSGEVPCRISLVCDGEEALDFLFQHGKFRRAPRPDLILLDLQLPKIDGREVLMKVRANEKLERIPVVVLTASLTHLKILQSENLRVESYLNKPIELAEFSRVVKSLRKFMLADVLLPQ